MPLIIFHASDHHAKVAAVLEKETQNEQDQPILRRYYARKRRIDASDHHAKVARKMNKISPS